MEILQLTVFFSGGLIAYTFGNAIYNLYFHPLAAHPGPLTWRASRLPFIYSLVRGRLVHDMVAHHSVYGPIVRSAPDELSFAAPSAWPDLFTVRPGHRQFLKNQVFWKPPPGSPSVFATTDDIAKHARQRKLMDRAFTREALSRQEGTVMRYVELLMVRLQEACQSRQSDGKANGEIEAEAEVDLNKYFNFYTFDLIGDLAFGEPFDCLSSSTYHPWVAMLFQFIQGLTFAMATRYYPIVERLLQLCIPPAVKKRMQAHTQLSKDKVQRRLNLETQRNDFMTPVVEALNSEKKMRSGEAIMSLAEVEGTGGLLILAGSETTATVLTGMLNKLTLPDATSRAVLARLTAEVRGAFKDKDDITFESVRKLPYLEATINEALRLTPAVPGGMPRMTPVGGETVRDPSGGPDIFLPAGTHVSVQPVALSMSPTYFQAPLQFRPERWLSAEQGRPAEFKEDRLDVVKPFGLGPRSCIGREMAWSSLRIVLARLVWEFDVSGTRNGETLDWSSLRNFVIVERKEMVVRIKPRTIDVAAE